ncbi:MAG: origin recognition complex subunit 3-like, partial [Trebouxia sp. A1-2]
MDWIDSTDESQELSNALRQPFEVLRPVPTQATARVQKVQTGKGKDKHHAMLQGKHENLLRAFPPAFPEETVQQQGLRQEACKTCWTALSQHLEAVLEQTNDATFQALLQFAATAHQDPNSSNSFAQRRRIIPTALTFAGGVNSADHAQTFPTLVNLLRQQGCYAAILHPSQLPSGKGVSAAINSVLCQFSGLETEADDMLALLAWYQDMLADPASQRVSPARPPATPFGQLQLTTPVKTTRSIAAAAAKSEVSPEGSVTSPLAKMGINTPTAKRTTGKPETKQAEEVLPAPERPLVVVIEEAEAVDTLTLQDLILVLSEAHAELPIVLVLGMATSAGALQQMLPVAAASMLEPQHFQLTSSMESVMRFINHQFMTHDFTTAVLRKGLQASSAAADMISQLQMELRATCTAWTAWAVALRWVNLAATICDGKPRLAHTLRVLYLDASSAKYVGSQDKKSMLDQLCNGIASLSIEQCIHLLKGLSGCAEQVWEGSKVMQQDQQMAQALIIELQAGSPTKENQPGNQHMPAASPPSGPQPAKAPGPSRPALAPSRRNAQHSSAANRQAAMRQQIEEAKAKAKAAKDAKAVVSWQTTMASKVADTLRSIVKQALGTPPAATSASELHCLTAAPRLAIHEALATPHKYLGTPYELGLSSKMDDACIAYQLFLEYGESVDVADWFSSFCAVHDSSDGAPEEEAQAAIVPKLKKRRGRPSKKVLQRDEQEQPEASASAGAGGISRVGSKSTEFTPTAESSQAAKTRRSRLANVTSATDQATLSSQEQAAGVAAPASTARPQRHASNKAKTDQCRRSSEPDDAAASGSTQETQSAPAELKADEAEAAAASKSLEELAVRFSQATKELQEKSNAIPAFCPAGSGIRYEDFGAAKGQFRTCAYLHLEQTSVAVWEECTSWIAGCNRMMNDAKPI